jgi:hypothetical protein
MFVLAVCHRRASFYHLGEALLNVRGLGRKLMVVVPFLPTVFDYLSFGEPTNAASRFDYHPRVLQLTADRPLVWRSTAILAGGIL